MIVPKKDTEVWFFKDAAGSVCIGFARAPIISVVNDGEEVLVPCVALTPREAIDLSDKLLNLAIRISVEAKPPEVDG